MVDGECLEWLIYSWEALQCLNELDYCLITTLGSPWWCVPVIYHEVVITSGLGTGWCL